MSTLWQDFEDLREKYEKALAIYNAGKDEVCHTYRGQLRATTWMYR